MRLDIASLEVFQAVVRHGGVSKAAAQLNRVQSSVSTRIRQLEDQLGEPLFLRDNKRMTLTDAGRNLLPYAERMLTLAREAADAVKTKDLNGTFCIGTMESTAAARLPQVLSRFRRYRVCCDPEIRSIHYRCARDAAVSQTAWAVLPDQDVDGLAKKLCFTKAGCPAGDVDCRCMTAN